MSAIVSQSAISPSSRPSFYVGLSLRLLRLFAPLFTRWPIKIRPRLITINVTQLSFIHSQCWITAISSDRNIIWGRFVGNLQWNCFNPSPISGRCYLRLLISLAKSAPLRLLVFHIHFVMAEKELVRQRVSYNGSLCTVRWRGEIEGLKGQWLGVEWDDPSRGKHDGVYAGNRYFTCQWHYLRRRLTMF